MNITHSLLSAAFLTAATVSAQIYVDPATGGNAMALNVTGVPVPGQAVFFEISGPPGAPAATLVATGNATLPFPPFGTLLVDPNRIIGSIGGTTGTLSRTVLPATAPGSLFVFQGIRLNGGMLELTNSARLFTQGVVGARPLLELIDPPQRTGALSVRFAGRATLPGSTIEVLGGAAPASGTASSMPQAGAFAIDVALRRNARNRLTFIETTPSGQALPPVGWEIAQDSEPPALFVDVPTDGGSTTEAAVTVVGRVGDRLSGTEGMRVIVQSGPNFATTTTAVVNPGIGTNGTFEAQGISLGPVGGATRLRVLAYDIHDNEARVELSVVRRAPVGVRLERVPGGDGQSAVIRTQLPQPVQILALRPDGAPFANKLISFQVVRSDGMVAALGGGTFARSVQVTTNAAGRAGVVWRVGSDAGQGNNRLLVTTAGANDDRLFCASALAEPVAQLNVSGGNEQTGPVGATLQAPLRVWASDGCNGVQNIPVIFEVIRGDGLVEAGTGNGPVSAATALTNECGIAEVSYTCGPLIGDQTIRARLLNQPNSDEAVFRVRALGLPVPGAPTTFDGMVLDNANQPLENATVELEVGGQTFSAASNANGCFSVQGITAFGAAELHVDGTTITGVGGQGLGADRYPSLHYDTLVVEGTTNALPRCVVLPVLRNQNETQFDPTQDVILTVDGIDGLEMRVRAGTVMRLADGTLAPAGTPMSLNQVHVDDIPMAMTDGAAPPFAWTLQPGGATFDPPIEITYPNMTGLPAGSASYFLSFDHDTSRFEIIGSGTVSEDGSRIHTDPGSGLRLAGWGCNCPPYSVTTDCDGCTMECISEGFINRGPAEPSIPDPRLMDTITFRLSRPPMDTGGRLKIDCPPPREDTESAIPAVPVDVSWTVLRPDGSTHSIGSGNETRPVLLDQCGVYRANFVANANRPCPPDTAYMSTSAAPVLPGNLTMYEINDIFGVDSRSFLFGGLSIAPNPTPNCRTGVVGSPAASYSLRFSRGEACCPGGASAPYLRGALINSQSGGFQWEACLQSRPFFIPIGPLASVPFFVEGRVMIGWQIEGASVSVTFCQPPEVYTGVAVVGSGSAELTLNAGIANIISIGGGVRFVAMGRVDVEGGRTFRGIFDGEAAAKGIATALLDLPLLPPARYTYEVDLGSIDLGPSVLFDIDPTALLR